MTRILIFISFLLFSSFNFAQNIPIGGWKEHLSYKNGISVTEGNGKVYVATKSGMFSLNKSDNSLDRLSKVNGLSDVEATVVNFNKYNNALLIAYRNSNIDILSNGTITNISDIKRKSIIGNKAINNIFFINQYAYLACGFGIVVIDMDRLEVKDTYFIGPNGNAINVTDITADATDFYASTATGVYTASLTNPNLANFTSWTKMPMAGSAFPNGFYNTIASYNGKIYANYSKYFTNGDWGKDSIYAFDPSLNTWTSFHPGVSETTFLLRQSNNQLLIVQEGGVTANGVYAGGYFSDYARARSAAMDNTGTLWIADSKFGLVVKRPPGGYEYFYPNGPPTTNVYNMSIGESNLWVAPGAKRTFFIDGLYQYVDGEWRNPRGNYPGGANLDTIMDIVNVLVDPANAKRVFATTWGFGMVEFYNNVPIKVYNASNSSLQAFDNALRTDGMALDANNELWVNASLVAEALSVRHNNGSWESINFSNIIEVNTAQESPQFGKMMIDKNDQKWILLVKPGGLIVYKGGTTADANSGNAKRLSTAAGNGGLPSADIFSIAEDQDGEIWIGTDKGVAVFYSPENVFTGAPFDAQQILVEQDGHVQILLETESITAIVVDDANRKWIGTARSGAFLMSADGTQQIYHFDVDNSPLLSNNIKNIVIDHITGEIYFATDKGIISYRGSAIEGKECFENVYAFPNPVRPDYSGPIAIKGLMVNTTVKITDISGSLVYETKSEGGQAIWNGKNFNGEKVSSGVYMVFCTSEESSCQKAATKILFIK
jgi:hypothetical protein